MEIEAKNKAIGDLKNNLDEITNSLRSRLSFIDFFGLSHFIYGNNQAFINKVQATYEKLNALGASLKIQHCSSDDVIFNLSTKILSLREKFLLSFGVKFVLPVYEPNFIKHFFPFETLTTRLNDMSHLNDLHFTAVCGAVKKLHLTCSIE